MRTQIFKCVLYSITLILWVSTTPSIGAEARFSDLVPGTTYYFDDFNPKSKPWVPGEFMNIEEVFKNYQYVEISLDTDGKVITVKQFIQGIQKDVMRYRVLPEGALQKEQ